MNKSQIIEYSRKYMSSIPAIICYKQVHNNYASISKPKSLLFSYSYIKEKIQVSSNAYYSQYGIAQRAANNQTLPFYVILWYIEKIGALTSKEEKFRKLYSKIMEGIGIGEEIMITDEKCKKDALSAINKIINLDPPYLLDKKEDKLLITLVGMLTESLLFNSDPCQPILQKLECMCRKVGICIKMMPCTMKNGIIEFKMLNSYGHIACTIQKIDDTAYWILYGREDIKNKRWYESVELLIKEEKKQSIYDAYKEKVHQYSIKTEMLTDFVQQFQFHQFFYKVFREFENSKDKLSTKPINKMIQIVHELKKDSKECYIPSIIEMKKILVEFTYILTNVSTYLKKTELTEVTTAIKEKEYNDFIRSYLNTTNNFRGTLSKYTKKLEHESSIYQRYTELVVSFIQAEERPTNTQLSNIWTSIIGKTKNAALSTMLSEIENLRFFSFTIYVNNQMHFLLDRYKTISEKNAEMIRELYACISKYTPNNEQVNEDKIKIDTITNLSKIITQCYDYQKDTKYDDLDMIISLLQACIDCINQKYQMEAINYPNLHTSNSKYKFIESYIRFTKLFTEQNAYNASESQFNKHIYEHIQQLKEKAEMETLCTLEEDCKHVLQLYEDKSINIALSSLYSLEQHFYKKILCTGIDSTDDKDILAELQRKVETDTSTDIATNQLIKQSLIDDVIKNYKEGVGKTLGSHPTIRYLSEYNIDEFSIHTQMGLLAGKSVIGSHAKLIELRK